jgi:UTP--glucose-1-phosphate uridylyltransferase
MTVEVAVVPVAGLGTRLLPLTRSIPKELLPLGSKPVLQHVVEELTSVGIRQIILITGAGEDSIRQHFEVNPTLQRQLHNKGKARELAELQSLTSDVRIDFVNQPQQLGLGHAIWCARDAVAERPFLIALGDAMFGLNNSSVSQRLIRTFQTTEADVAIAFQQVPEQRVSRYGVAKPGTMNINSDGAFEVLDMIEKPAIEEAPSHYAIAARYVCRANIFERLADTKAGVGGEIQLTDAFCSLINTGGKVVGVPLADGEKRYDVGNFDSYFSAFAEIACSDPVHGNQLRQHLQSLLDAT